MPNPFHPFVPPFTHTGHGFISDSNGATILVMCWRISAKQLGGNPDEMEDRLGFHITELMNASAVLAENEEHEQPPSTTPPQLTDSEIQFLMADPEALDALADYHSMQETIADSVGEKACTDYHEKKRIEYREAAAAAKTAIDSI